ncbi:hypothetical protein ED551_11780 [Muribaculaceae bacterium Isolate-013 (NCI)]|jgi:hypothetical protein|nr:hypothetical protein ED551_11780 [Muribaculaceae bacterium Isolate-013 (NCI)]
MSYTRHFSKTITVHYSGSVSYPASQSGGTKSYSGSTKETIHFNVTVDTDPFDESVEHMKDGVDLLTGSVAATEAAQVSSIRENSARIGQTIISGFFKTVKSDISQQITELRTRTDALLVQLNELAKRCNDKRRQMGVDYQRISSRYSKIFDDLNKELDNRIHSIDEPVFRLTRQTDDIGSGAEKLVAAAAVSAGENARVHAEISASLAKRQAVNAIEKGHRFLQMQYATDRLLNRCLRPGGEQQSITTPFCVADTTTGPGTSRTDVYASPMLGAIPAEQLADRLPAEACGATVSDDDARIIAEYFNSEVASAMQADTSEHSRRVAELTTRLFNLSNTAAPGK